MLRDVWNGEAQVDRSQRSRRPSAIIIPAVEVTEAGASYNPDRQLHQAVLAKAVAEETAKANKQLLLPAGPNRKVLAEATLDLDGLQVCSSALPLGCQSA